MTRSVRAKHPQPKTHLGKGPAPSARAFIILLMRRIIENFRIDDRAMRYSQFVPRLYNYCLSLGFQRESMMPSRAFCSDESGEAPGEGFRSIEGANPLTRIASYALRPLPMG